jgi:hypothetical protein
MNRLKDKFVGSYPVDGGAPESDARLVTGILAVPPDGCRSWMSPVYILVWPFWASCCEYVSRVKPEGLSNTAQLSVHAHQEK